MAHGDAREGKWRGNWRMEWVASTLHTTSEHGVSSITTADANISAANSRLNWRPRRFKWTRPFRRKTKSGFLRVCYHISNAVYIFPDCPIHRDPTRRHINLPEKRAFKLPNGLMFLGHLYFLRQLYFQEFSGFTIGLKASKPEIHPNNIQKFTQSVPPRKHITLPFKRPTS